MPSEGSSRTLRPARPARLKPARGLRFHLITWTVMVLAASVFLGLNVVPQGPYVVGVTPLSKLRIIKYRAGFMRGWPLHYEQVEDPKPAEIDIEDDIVYLKRNADGSYVYPESPLPVNSDGERYVPDPNKGEISMARRIPGKVGRLGAMFCNLLLALSACGVAGLTVEWFARKAGARSEGRQG